MLELFVIFATGATHVREWAVYIGQVAEWVEGRVGIGRSNPSARTAKTYMQPN